MMMPFAKPGTIRPCQVLSQPRSRTSTNDGITVRSAGIMNLNMTSGKEEILAAKGQAGKGKARCRADSDAHDDRHRAEEKGVGQRPAEVFLEDRMVGIQRGVLGQEGSPGKGQNVLPDVGTRSKRRGDYPRRSVRSQTMATTKRSR